MVENIFTIQAEKIYPEDNYFFNIYIYIYIYIYIVGNIYIYIYIYICVCVCECVYIYIYIYISRERGGIMRQENNVFVKPGCRYVPNAM